MRYLIIYRHFFHASIYIPSLRSIEFRYPNKDGTFEGSAIFKIQMNKLYVESCIPVCEDRNAHFYNE